MNVPSEADVRLAYIDREDFIAQVRNVERRSDDEIGEEFDAFMKKVRFEAWGEGYQRGCDSDPFLQDDKNPYEEDHA